MADPGQPLRLVIFDFDGTLSDSGGWFLSIVDQVADRFGFNRVEPAEVEQLRGTPTRDVIARLGIPAWKLPFISRHVRRMFGANSHRIRLFDGVPEMLAAIEGAGVKLAIVTSNSEANARAVLGPANSARIAWWACGASLFGKAPRFRKILRMSGMPAAHCLSLGDETRDIEAAREVGITAGAVLWGYAHAQAFAHLRPDIAFSTPQSVVDHVLGASGG
ncbi:HAD hydrolase-like protein [Sphingomonas sp.]|uniref:HAD hydrolase-like protein n=1 Tax=Sphingomonas sp. TaxID=28214 RepID=UPI001ED6667D|nr:HAD hydrolase-like protein [Sphingomonas sp.]MBX3594253.1 HAD hydrolase-like protein [Sphingomonas sp.]